MSALRDGIVLRGPPHPAGAPGLRPVCAAVALLSGLPAS